METRISNNSFNQNTLRNSFDSKSNSSFSHRSVSISPENRYNSSIKDPVKKLQSINYGRDSRHVRRRSASRSYNEANSIKESPNLYKLLGPQDEKHAQDPQSKRQTIMELHKD